MQLLNDGGASADLTGGPVYNYDISGGSGGGYIAPPGSGGTVTADTGTAPAVASLPAPMILPPAPKPSPCSTCAFNSGGGPSAPFAGTLAGGGYISPPAFLQAPAGIVPPATPTASSTASSAAAPFPWWLVALVAFLVLDRNG